MLPSGEINVQQGKYCLPPFYFNLKIQIKKLEGEKMSKNQKKLKKLLKLDC